MQLVHGQLRAYHVFIAVNVGAATRGGRHTHVVDHDHVRVSACAHLYVLNRTSFGGIWIFASSVARGTALYVH